MRHPVPPDAEWLYVFGSATLMAFLLQVVTGAALTSAHVPAIGDVHQSLQYITDQATLQRLLCGMHYFGTSAMMILIGTHAIRVCLTGQTRHMAVMA